MPDGDMEDASVMPAATRRDMIVDFVTSAGQARATQIAAHLGVAVSMIGGHLRALVRQGRLVRLSWGLYAPGHATCRRNRA